MFLCGCCRPQYVLFRLNESIRISNPLCIQNDNHILGIKPLRIGIFVLLVSSALEPLCYVTAEVVALHFSRTSVLFRLKCFKEDPVLKESARNENVINECPEYQVIEHEEFWDLSASSAIAKAYFWTSRRLYATIEGGKDLVDLAKTISSKFPREKQNMEIYPDPSGDPCVFVICTRTPVFFVTAGVEVVGGCVVHASELTLDQVGDCYIKFYHLDTTPPGGVL